ncbi:hypothetical protein BC831DRAFT_463044 [Entophlyctis helioformis]|nr:hypothetical protein BC831DRAFT_463044 [Entophlyctis helioformis]
MWHCRLVLVPRHAAVRATRAARVDDREIHRLSASPSPHHRHSVSLSLRSIDCRVSTCRPFPRRPATTRRHLIQPRHQPLLPLQQPASRSLSTASRPTAPCTSERHPSRRGWRDSWCRVLIAARSCLAACLQLSQLASLQGCPPIARIHWCVTTSSLMPCSAFV